MSNTAAITNQAQITEEAFLSADTDGNGYLDQAEFDKAFSGYDLSTYDTDKNSLLSFSEATGKTNPPEATATKGASAADILGVVSDGVELVAPAITIAADAEEVAANANNGADETETAGGIIGLIKRGVDWLSSAFSVVTGAIQTFASTTVGAAAAAVGKVAGQVFGAITGFLGIASWGTELVHDSQNVSQNYDTASSQEQTGMVTEIVDDSINILAGIASVVAVFFPPAAAVAAIAVGVAVLADVVTGIITGGDTNDTIAESTTESTTSTDTTGTTDTTGAAEESGTTSTVDGFDEADTDGNGSLDRSEFEDALPGEDFDQYDDNGDGKVTEEEVANNIQLSQEDMEKVLNNLFMSQMLEKIKKKREEADAELVNNNKFATTPTSFI